jgi:hypothetical protein
MGRACGTYGDKRTACKILVRDLGKRVHLEDTGRDGAIIFKLMLKKQNGWALTRLIWLRTGRRDWLLGTFFFYKMLGISGVVQDLLAFHA